MVTEGWIEVLLEGKYKFGLKEYLLMEKAKKLKVK
jgi:hypothetical protein